MTAHSNPDQSESVTTYRVRMGMGAAEAEPLREILGRCPQDVQRLVERQLWLRSVFVEQRRRTELAERDSFDARADRVLEALDPRDDDRARCQHCVPAAPADERSFMCEDCAGEADAEVQGLRDENERLRAALTQVEARACLMQRGVWSQSAVGNMGRALDGIANRALASDENDLTTGETP